MATENETHEEFDLLYLSGYLSLIDDGERVRAVVRSCDTGTSRRARLLQLRFALEQATWFITEQLKSAP